LGIAGGFSFFPTKTLTTGEGGMIITDNEAVYRSASMLRNQGKNPNLGNKISEMGHNWRISEFTAVLGVQQMERAPGILADRGRIADFYNAAFQEFQGISPISLPPGTTSSHYKYIAYLDPVYDRGEVKRVMREKYAVSLPGEVYTDLCHNEPIWDAHTYCGKRRTESGQIQCNRWPQCGCGTRQESFPGAEQLSKHHICLPMYPGLDHEDLEHVIESLDRTLHEDLKQG
jgi:dTDP-4-amino-4,6-dideoxygalactose transaminase